MPGGDCESSRWHHDKSREEAHSLGVKEKVMQASLDELSENLMNVASNTSHETTGALRRADELAQEARRVNANLNEAGKCVDDLNERIQKFETHIKAQGFNGTGAYCLEAQDDWWDS